MPQTLQAPPIRTPFLSIERTGLKGQQNDLVSDPWLRWFMLLSAQVNIVQVPAPTNATDSGTAGQMSYDGAFIYICVAANTWRRMAVAAW